MKSLQDFKEENWTLRADVTVGGVSRVPQKPDEIILLLHGLAERGRRIYRKLIPYLPENALVIAPNGTFTIPRQKDDSLSLGYAWYFYDRGSKSYLVNQDAARSVLKSLVAAKNPQHLPVTIIGFSQGGYLAPLVGQDIEETKLVIGLGCEFRHNLITEKPKFPMVAIHGENDAIISPTLAQNEIRLLGERGFDIPFYSVEATAHEITKSMGLKVKDVLESYGKRSL